MMILRYLLAVTFVITTSLYLNAQITTGTFTWDGIERDYILHLPNGYTEGEEIPLVFNFHGFGSNALEQQFYANMLTVANDNKFAVCYPNGVDKAWNVGWEFGSSADDVGFINGLLDFLLSEYSINKQKVYSTGMSNGGFFSYTLACELSHRFAAIASVTGSMVDTYVPQCDPARNIPMMQIHGTNDLTVGYDGTPFVSIPIEDLISNWTAKMDCATPGDTTYIDDINIEDNCTALRIDYTDCRDELEFVFYKVIDGGHTWPGSSLDFEGFNTNRDFAASEVIWEFFNRFEIPTSVSTEPELEIERYTISPNPAQDVIYIETSEKISTLEIFNTQGQLVRSQNNPMARIDIHELESGIYFLRVNGSAAVQQILKM